jgi:hypothetical protein
MHTINNQPVPSTMHQPIPQHVPSTSASTMHQICTNHASNTHKI